MNADILVMGTPIWLGQPSSVAKRVMERMDAFLGETDDKGRMPSYGRVAIVVVVGNEDGAHHCAAVLKNLNVIDPRNIGQIPNLFHPGIYDLADLRFGHDGQRKIMALVETHHATNSTFAGGDQ